MERSAGGKGADGEGAAGSASVVAARVVSLLSSDVMQVSSSVDAYQIQHTAFVVAIIPAMRKIAE
jgi:hypothetical protein